MTPKETIQSVYDAFTRGDVAHILSLVAPAATWRQSSMLPWGGNYSGPEGAAEFFQKLDATMETTAFRANENIEIGNEVLSFGYYEGRGRNTGKTAGSDWMFRWRVVDGKIVSYEAYIDSAALLTAVRAQSAAA